MAVQHPVTATPTTGIAVERRSAGYHPSVWGDYFLQYAVKTEMVYPEEEKEIDELQRKVKKKLLGDVDKPLGLLNLIDHIQRLGIGYRFERDIDEALVKVYRRCFEGDDGATMVDCGDDLHTTALLFRLLRQHGFKIPCHVFTKFMDNDKGTFPDSLAMDVRGLLSLYEASHCRVHGEDILEEALAFCLKTLQSILHRKELTSPLADEVDHALKQCIHKGLTRLEARFYIEIYSEDEALLTLAKLDFNSLQRQHQKELADIVRWWKDLDCSRKFPFARDRITECYFWILGVFFEPQYQLARKILTKVIALISVMDDIYDVYGTLEELQLLTSAIERWDTVSLAAKELPDYMLVFYEELVDVYGEIERDLMDNGRSYRLVYAKEAMKNLARGYLYEAKWLHQHYVPKVEEYMSVATVTTGYSLLATTSFVGIMEENVAEDVFKWLSTNPKILRGSTVICRLMDDIVSHKLEQERGHVSSAVECFMSEYSVSEEEAKSELWKRVDDGWKDMNEDCFDRHDETSSIPMNLHVRILNLARVIDVLYKDKDRYTHADGELKEFVTSLLVQNIHI